MAAVECRPRCFWLEVALFDEVVTSSTSRTSKCSFKVLWKVWDTNKIKVGQLVYLLHSLAESFKRNNDYFCSYCFFFYCKKVQMLKCDIICDPQRRARTAEVFGQFGGESCQDSLGDREFCVTSAKCDLPPPPPCSDSEFQCESGISPSFKSPTVTLSLLF